MKELEITGKKTQIHDLLSAKRLKEALDELLILIRESGRNEWILEQEQLHTTYKYMLQYTVEGIQDPERQKVYQKLVQDTYELTDLVAAHLLPIPPAVYEPPFSETSQSEMSGLFHRIYRSNDLKEEIASRINQIIEAGDELFESQALMVSALNLSLLHYFDSQKFDLLFRFAESDHVEIRQRALIGLLIAFYHFDERLKYYPSIRGRLMVMDEDPDFKVLVKEVVIQMIRSKDTEELTRKMQTEIMPEMIKLSPQVRARLDLDKLLSDSLSDDKNPEWEEILGDSPGLKDKMEELSEMQMAGDDVFMSSFAMLKGFPFFHHLINWFYPFSKEHPDIISLTENQGVTDGKQLDVSHFVESVEKSFYLCNSDKYSICFGMKNMPPDMQQFLSDGLKAESDQMEEILNDEILVDPLQQSKKVIRQYTQDLYRFFKLYPGKEQFNDIFTWSFDFVHKSYFQDLFKGDAEVLYAIGAFYHDKENYTQAAAVYELLENMGETKAEVLQKIAFANQKMGNYPKALEYYRKADITVPESIWNLKKIGLCYRYLKEPDKALQYYRQAEHLDPEDLNTAVSIGHCLLDLQEYEEALRSYFKVEYLAPNNPKVWRPIAWCSFIVGKFEQARKYYDRLLEKGPNRYDLINMGHLDWCEGKRSGALERYRESINRSETELDEFMEVFEQDLDHLMEHGVDPDDIPIMLDQLRFLLD